MLGGASGSPASLPGLQRGCFLPRYFQTRSWRAEGAGCRSQALALCCEDAKKRSGLGAVRLEAWRLRSKLAARVGARCGPSRSPLCPSVT